MTPDQAHRIAMLLTVRILQEAFAQIYGVEPPWQAAFYALYLNRNRNR